MKKLPTTLFTCLALLANYFAPAQSLVLPTYSTDTKSKIEIGSRFEPNAKFLQNNPEFLTRGKYLIQNIRRDRYGSYVPDTILCSGTYPAFVCTASPAVSTNSRFMCYLTVAPYQIATTVKTKEVLQKEAMAANCDAKDIINNLTGDFKKVIDDYFAAKAFVNYYVSPKTGRYLNTDSKLRANDVLLEFFVDKINIAEKKDESGLTYVPYTLFVKDITGVILSTKRQVCLISGKLKNTRDDTKIALAKASLKSAIESMLNSYFADAEAARQTRYITNARVIKSQTEKNYLTLINYKATMESLQEDKAAGMCELKSIKRRLEGLGVTGLDISKTNFNFNTPNPSFNAAATSVATGIASIATSIAAAVRDAQIASLQKQAKEEYEKMRQLTKKEDGLQKQIDDLSNQTLQLANARPVALSGSNEPMSKVAGDFWEGEQQAKPTPEKKSKERTEVKNNLKPAPDTRSFTFEEEGGSSQPIYENPQKATAEPTKLKSNENYWNETEKTTKP